MLRRAAGADHGGALRLERRRRGRTPIAAVVADWDSYYADLNLSGDDGIADMWEGIFRTTRALFRLTGIPEPDKSELIALSRELPGLAAEGSDVLYPEVPEVLAELDDAGLLLGVISHAPTNQIRAVLAPVLLAFQGADLGGGRCRALRQRRRALPARRRARGRRAGKLSRPRRQNPAAAQRDRRRDARDPSPARTALPAALDRARAAGFARTGRLLSGAERAPRKR